ncbi:MAG: XRE family transcriptional regulator [Ignavibacteriae bacterium]|nr:MAG: XRE family transcriptional regulator [Ignavibacteriota bacterium]
MITRRNRNWEEMADPAVVKEIGNALKQMRLNVNLSQEQLAKKSGLDRTTISRIESGRAATLLSLVQILRALDKLNIMNIFVQEPEISPIKLLKLQEKKRQRAYHHKSKETGNNK